MDDRTRRWLSEAGVGPGMRVLDVGTGAGPVALIAARLVGPTGSVVGLDRDGRRLVRARTAAAAAGLDNVTFVEGTVEDAELGAFDAVIGRRVLMHLPDPEGALRTLAEALVLPSGLAGSLASLLQAARADAMARTIKVLRSIEKSPDWTVRL